MQCKKRDIQELIPAYLEQVLGAAERRRVDEHLAGCAECRAELSVLSMLAQEPVPDPGGAFWDTMPERIYREVQRRKGSAAADRRRSADFSSALHLFRWAVIGAAVLLVTTVAWYAVIRDPVEPERQAASVSSEYFEPEIVLQDLTAAELQSAARWAEAGFSAIGREAAAVSWHPQNEAIHEELLQMDSGELERVSQMLDVMKQEG